MSIKCDKNKFSKSTDIIINISDYELDGDIENLVEYFKQIIRKNEKKYHRIYI